jgi:farnesyl-diphosphate farnesyltransferase
MDAFVAKHLQGVSRTYAIVVPMLPAGLADAVGIAYLLMRVVDTVEDASALDTPSRLQRFELLERGLAGDADATRALTGPLGDTQDEQALLRELPEVLARVAALPAAQREAISHCARQMIAGVRKLIARAAERGLPYPGVRDLGELREYCYYVAGVVGEMLCTLMADHQRLPKLLELNDLAIELGTGLQLVNILKDAVADAKYGRRYLPVVAQGVPESDKIYRAALIEARRCLRRGVDYVLALPGAAVELRTFCGLPIAWGALTLARAELDAAGAKITRTDVVGTIETFGRIGADDVALRNWLQGLLGPEERIGLG